MIRKVENKKKVIILGVIVFLVSMVVGYSVGRKYFKGYGIETRQRGNKLTVKTDNTEWTVKILPKKLSLEQKFALESWRDILNVRVSEGDEYLEKIKAKEYIQLRVEVLAARIKTGQKDFKDVLVSNKDIKKSLSLLNETSPIIADMFVGNWNGYCSVSELNKFINYPKTASQVGVVRKMIISYSSF
jgi:hypothetical protein